MSLPALIPFFDLVAACCLTWPRRQATVLTLHSALVFDTLLTPLYITIFLLLAFSSQRRGFSRSNALGARCVFSFSSFLASGKKTGECLMTPVASNE